MALSGRPVRILQLLGPALLCVAVGYGVAYRVQHGMEEQIREAGRIQLERMAEEFRAGRERSGDAQWQAALLAYVPGLVLVAESGDSHSVTDGRTSGAVQDGDRLSVAWPGGGRMLLTMNFAPAAQTARDIEHISWLLAALLLLFGWWRYGQRPAAATGSAAGTVPPPSDALWNLAEDLPACLVEAAEDGTVIRCNDAADSLFGALADDVGQVRLQLQRQPAWHSAIRPSEGEGPVMLSLPSAAGTFDVQIWTLRAASEGRDALLLLQEITEQRQLKRELAQKSATIQHEIRLPVSILQLEIDGLRSEWEVRDDKAAAMQRMQNALERLRVICSQLTMGSADSSAGDGDFCPEQLVNEIAKVHRPLLQRRQIALNCRGLPEKSRSLRLQGESRLLRTALDSLLDNILNYCPAGSDALIELSAEDALRILVADNGFGIPQAERERLFVAGFRGDRTRDLVAGTGMGLMLARQSIEKLGGTLTIEDRLPKALPQGKDGCCFVIGLPL